MILAPPSVCSTILLRTLANHDPKNEHSNVYPPPRPEKRSPPPYSATKHRGGDIRYAVAAKIQAGTVNVEAGGQCGVSAHRRPRYHREPLHGGARRYRRHHRLAVPARLRLTERLLLHPRRREGRAFRPAPSGVHPQPATLSARHQRAPHPILLAGGPGRDP